ncbi:MAG: hypothetical protein NWE98_10600 [Candidatus Bathyarchaeota archaeon]|nr:hypothetical protein [Candidatus Bathyarchaeota archaeon]
MAQQSIEQPKQLELLKQLIGEWNVGVAMKMENGTVLSGCGTMTAKEIASGFGVSTEIDLDLEGFGMYTELGLWSFDRWTGKVHLYSVTSSGAVHDHVGDWKDDKTIELQWTGIYEAKDAKEEVTIKWEGTDEIRVFETDYAEGKVNLTAEYVFRRKEA